MAFPENTTLIDGFDRADGSVSAGAGAAIWQEYGVGSGAAGLTVSLNRLGTSVSGQTRVSKASFGPKFDITLDVVATASGYLALYFCLQNASAAGWEGYWLIIDQAAGTWTIRKKVAGVSSDVAPGVPAGVLKVGDKIGIRRDGSLIEARFFDANGWLLAASGNDATFTSGPIAPELGGSAWRLDNLSATIAAARSTANGFPRDASGALITSAGPGTYFENGFLKDASGLIVTTTTRTNAVFSEGFLRSPVGALVIA